MTSLWHPRPHPVSLMAKRCRAKWARARRSFRRGKISRRVMLERLSRTWNFPSRPLWTVE